MSTLPQLPRRAHELSFALAIALATTLCASPAFASGPGLESQDPETTGAPDDASESSTETADPVAAEKVDVAMLLLSGPEPELTRKLSQALHHELRARMQTSLQDLSLQDLEFTLGCDPGDIQCLADATGFLNSPKIIHGSLRPMDGHYLVSLGLIDLRGRRLSAELTQSVSAEELGEDQVGDTMTRLVDRLLGTAPPDAQTQAQPDTSEPDEPEAQVDSEQERPPQGEADVDKDKQDAPGDEVAGTGRLVLGRTGPPKLWQRLGLGVSAGLTLGAAATATGLSLAGRSNGPLNRDLRQAAADSLTDANPDNDISPNAPGDLCAAARLSPAGQPGTVTNVAMTQVCNKTDDVNRAATGMWIGTGVLAASTAVFTVLYFTHRKGAKDSGGKASARRHELRMSPIGGRGKFGLVVGGKF